MCYTSNDVSQVKGVPHRGNALIKAKIVGLGAYVPTQILSNHDLEKMVDTSDAWITERTGIKARHIVAPEEATSDLALHASLKALAQSGIPGSAIDMIVVATSTPDHILPPTACRLQEAIGAEKAGAFDVQATCSGFIYALDLGAQFIETKRAKNVLVVGADVMSRITNWKDRTTCILFGDGAGAAVLTSSTDGTGVQHTQLRSDGTLFEQLWVPAGGVREPASQAAIDAGRTGIYMEGRKIFKHAVTRMEEVILETLDEAGLTITDVDWLIPHQANYRILTATAKQLGLPEEKVVINVDRYGNTSAATIPIAWEEALADGRIQPGQTLVLVAFGGGLTWAASVIRT